MQFDGPHLTWRQTIACSCASFLGTLWGWSQAIPWAAICGVVGTVVIPAWKLANDQRVKLRDRRIEAMGDEMAGLRRDLAAASDARLAAEAALAAREMIGPPR